MGSKLVTIKNLKAWFNINVIFSSLYIRAINKLFIRNLMHLIIFIIKLPESI